MPLNQNIRKVMVIGSGPIVIGQAAEFDYAGTQARSGDRIYSTHPLCLYGLR